MMVAAMTMIRTITTVVTPPMTATKLPEFDDGTAIDGPTGTVRSSDTCTDKYSTTIAAHV